MTNSYSAHMRSVAPSGSPASYSDPKTIDALLKSSDPGAVAESGRSYQRFASAYEKIAAELLSMRTDLHEAWDGQDAAAAQSQLREVWAAATTVHKTASTFGIVVERHGSESLAWYKNNKPPSKDLAEAQSWMTGANERVSQSWASLPQDLSTTLPPSAMPVADHTSPVSDSSNDGGSSGSAGGTAAGGGGSRHGKAPGSSDFLSGGEHKTSSGGTVSQLAGLPETGGGFPGGGTGLPGGGTGLLPGGTSLSPGAGSGVPFGSMGDPGVIGSVGGVVSGRAGSPGFIASNSVAAAEEVQAGAAARSSAGPMLGGGGSGREERERTRQTWLAEDEEVWTGDIRSTPQIIGDEPGAVRPPEPTTPVEPSMGLDIDLTGDDIDLADILDQLEEPKAKDTATEIAELRAKLERLERQAQSEPGTATLDGDTIGGADWMNEGDV